MFEGCGGNQGSAYHIQKKRGVLWQRAELRAHHYHRGKKVVLPFILFLFLVYSFSCLSHFVWKWTPEPNINFAWPEMNKNIFLLVFCCFNKLASPTRRGTPELPGGRYRRELRELEARTGWVLWAAWLRVLEKITPEDWLCGGLGLWKNILLLTERNVREIKDEPLNYSKYKTDWGENTAQ